MIPNKTNDSKIHRFWSLLCFNLLKFAWCLLAMFFAVMISTKTANIYRPTQKCNTKTNELRTMRGPTTKNHDRQSEHKPMRGPTKSHNYRVYIVGI